MMYGGFGTFGTLGMLFSLVITVAVLGGIAWLVFWLVRKSGSSGIQPQEFLQSQPTRQQSPREILQARYARGEITQEQYREMLAEID